MAEIEPPQFLLILSLRPFLVLIGYLTYKTALLLGDVFTVRNNLGSQIWLAWIFYHDTLCGQQPLEKITEATSCYLHSTGTKHPASHSLYSGPEYSAESTVDKTIKKEVL